MVKTAPRNSRDAKTRTSLCDGDNSAGRLRAVRVLMMNDLHYDRVQCPSQASQTKLSSSSSIRNARVFEERLSSIELFSFFFLLHCVAIGQQTLKRERILSRSSVICCGRDVRGAMRLFLREIARIGRAGCFGQ